MRKSAGENCPAVPAAVPEVTERENCAVWILAFLERVQEIAETNLGSKQAMDLLDELHNKLNGDAALTLTIAWRLVKPGSVK